MAIAFGAVIQLRGVNPFVLVSRNRASAIRPNWRKPMPVIVRLNRQPDSAWRVNMMPVGDGSFFLYIHGGMRKASGVTIGSRIRIAVEFDRAYRGGPAEPTPRWFTEALRSNASAAEGWKALTPSRKKEIVRYLVRLNSSEARARNLARVLHVLSGGQARYMGRDWLGGS